MMLLLRQCADSEKHLREDRMGSKGPFHASVGLAALAIAGPLAAQQTSETSAASAPADNGLADIVVTAQRRASRRSSQ